MGVLGKELKVSEMYVNFKGQVILITKIFEVLDGKYGGLVLRVSYITSDKRPAEFTVPKEVKLDMVHIDSPIAPIWVRDGQ